MKNKFFCNIWVFFLVINLIYIYIRIHHAYNTKKEKGIKLEYFFNKVCDKCINNYKDYFCAIICNIFHKYGIKTFYPIFKKTYNIIIILFWVLLGLALNKVAKIKPSQPLNIKLNVQKQIA